MPSEDGIMCWAEAPSNIALIKYMGKVERAGKNFPSNPSLSVTLPELRTRVEISQNPLEVGDQWEPLSGGEWSLPSLSDNGRVRFLGHWQFLKEQVGLTGSFLIRSGNNFPSDCGLASSASSFAALTMAARELLIKQDGADLTTMEWANLSRQGSGSSCRSFFGPMAYWKNSEITSVESPFGSLLHDVVVVDAGKKEISSSEAHLRVQTSLLNEGRSLRAEHRMEGVLSSFKNSDWKSLFEVVWSEFWDMHALFETSTPSFGYMTDRSLFVLREIERFWQTEGDGPLVTMDAGANIHLLYRPDQLDLYNKWKGRWV